VNSEIVDKTECSILKTWMKVKSFCNTEILVDSEKYESGDRENYSSSSWSLKITTKPLELSHRNCMEEVFHTFRMAPFSHCLEIGRKI
jgi:hypothetical protein